MNLNLKRLVKRILMAIIAILIIIWSILPLYWIISNSFKVGEAITAYPPQIVPAKPRLDNYIAVFQKEEFSSRFLSSTFVAILNTFFSVTLGALAGYGFSRFRFKGKDNILFWILSTRMFPPIIASIPFFIVMNTSHITDTIWALIISYTTFNLPFVVWMMKGFFDDVPIDLEESALVDGASRFQAMTRIAFPLAAPGLAASAIFCFILSWNEFLFALILTSNKAMTLPVAITGYLRWGEGIFWGQISAMAVIITIPVFIFATLVQNQLVRGMTFGALKE